MDKEALYNQLNTILVYMEDGQLRYATDLLEDLINQIRNS